MMSESIRGGYKMTELGEMPEEWEVTTLLNVVGDKNDLIIAGPFGSNLKVEDYRDEGIPIIRLQNIDFGKFLNKDIKYISPKKADELSYHSFIKGDIVLAKLGDPIGKTCIIPHFLKRGVVVSDVVRIRVDSKFSEKKFILQCLNSSSVFYQLNKDIIGTTRPRVNLDQVRNLFIPFPPLSEQHRIAEILSTIDKTIERTEALIEKYRHIKAGLMSDLLTRGIDEEGRIRSEETHEFKDSPLGRVPEEWEVMNIGKISEVVTKGTTPTTYGYNYTDMGISFVRVENITDNGYINLNDAKFISVETHQFLNRSKLKEGDVLFSIAGAVGRCALVSSNILPANINQAISLIRFKKKDQLDLKLLLQILLSNNIQNQIELESTALAQTNLNLEQIKNLQLLMPPLPEQHHIAQILTAADTYIEKEQTYLNKLQQIKKGLMQDLLTGKVRVTTTPTPPKPAEATA
jgi:type I restriction enzyme S subunit